MSTSSDSGSSDEAGWLDVEPEEEEEVTVVSLLDSKTFSEVQKMLRYCREQYNFDLTCLVGKLQLDFHGAVKLVNFIRATVREHKPLPNAISLEHFEHDRFLKPVLENDAVLISIDEILDVARDESQTTVGDATGSTQEALAAKKQLESDLEVLRSQFANYRAAAEHILDRRWGEDSEPGKDHAQRKTDSDYFQSYATHDIHETMLKDAVRTDSYRDFIYNNKNLFLDKVVLDIGCGTGILSMFCAKAGAKKVIAVDNSDIIGKARENIFNNGLANVVTCLRGAIEDVILPVDHVDIIVSEWMGYCLLYEAMLPSVLFARDKYLRPGGLMVPSSATLWIAPVADQDYVSDHISYWRDVYGFNMEAMQEGIYDEARIEMMPRASLCGEGFPFKVLDLHSVAIQDLIFSTPWECTLGRAPDQLDGFLIWFDIFFATSAHTPTPKPETLPGAWSEKNAGNVAFTTGPFGKETHWKQGLLIAPGEKCSDSAPQGTSLTGEVTFSVPEGNTRALTIEVMWGIAGREKRRHLWKLK